MYTDIRVRYGVTFMPATISTADKIRRSKGLPMRDGFGVPAPVPAAKVKAERVRVAVSSWVGKTYRIDLV